jgi:hypothetical protein
MFVSDNFGHILRTRPRNPLVLLRLVAQYTDYHRCYVNLWKTIVVRVVASARLHLLDFRDIL